MKEMIRKLRCWLIRKLGGFDVRHESTVRVTKINVPVSPVKVTAGCTVCYTNLWDVKSGFEAVKRELADKLANYIYGNMLKDLVLLECKEGHDPWVHCYRASVYLMPASAGLWTEGNVGVVGLSDDLP